MRRILVTGGGGFIGFHLSRHLAEQPDVELTIADNWFRAGAPDGEIETLRRRPRVRVASLDLTSRAEWDELSVGGTYDEIYHLAAINGTRFFYERPYDVLRVNTLGCVHLVDWLSATEKFARSKVVFASSSEVYAGLEAMGRLPLPTPETVGSAFTDLANPRISYGVSKLAGELAIRHGAARGGRSWVILRYHNVYGPRMGTEHVIPALCERVARREDPLRVFGAEQRRAFCYVDDAVEATRQLMERPVSGEVVHVGNPADEVTMEDLAVRVAACAGYQPALERVLAPAGSVSRRCPDVAKLQRLTGWQPRVALDEGLARTYRWYAEQGRSTALAR